jgi:Flp pilus assembly protein TadG
MHQRLMFQIAARSEAMAVVLVLTVLVLIAASARHFLRRLYIRTEGAATIEFALCLLPLLLIVGGIIDFGHLWYMESVLTTASREGARYATRYTTDASGANRLTPANLPKSVAAYINENYGPLLPSDAELTVTPGDTGYNSTTAGLPVSVQVTAKKHWFFIANLVPGLPNPKDLRATTVMSLE